MIIVSVNEHDHYCRVVLGRDGHLVSKHIRVCQDSIQTIRSLMKAMREADRDISFMSHGDLMHCEDETANIAKYKAAASA